MAGAELLLHFNFAHLPFMANTGLSINHKKGKIRRFQIQVRAGKYHALRNQVRQLQAVSLKVNYPAYCKSVVMTVGPASWGSTKIRVKVF